MSGIYLVLVCTSWLLISFAFTAVIARLLPRVWWAHYVRGILFLALLPLPLIDEIVAKRQFHGLCSQNTTINFDRAKAVGRTVYLEKPRDVEVSGTWVQVKQKPWHFVDARSGETILSYNTFAARGGLLARALGISEGDTPLLFKGSCTPLNPPGSADGFAELGIKYIEPPIRGETQ